MNPKSPESFIRQAVDRCANCDWCRDNLKESSCLFMRRLFRLHDRERAGRRAISDVELARLTDLCNLCGICPCVEIRTWIRQAKDGFVEQKGLSPTVRVLEDVRLLSKLGGAVPSLTNALLGDHAVGRGIKRVTGIHPERKLPLFPRQSFDVWAKRRGLHEKPVGDGPKVAYFTGCTARYLFPDVAKATVEVLERNGIAVYVPPQQCCGMPTMLEGDRAFTRRTAGFNVGELTRVVEDGYDIVCSCPTCGYFYKSVLPADALSSPEYRARVDAVAQEEGGDLLRIGERLRREEFAFHGRADPMFERATQPSTLRFVMHGLMRDRGYFGMFDGVQRMRIASRVYDLGEYLLRLDAEGRLNRNFGAVPGHMAYFAPCHQREQNIGQPWLKLMALLPGANAGRVGEPLDCCGLGGIMGFKKKFHPTSVAIGRRLMRKVEKAAPETLLTDCLSCRLQFNQMLPQPVAHPVEILNAAYRAAEK
ncbi:MAG TPA: heterodisulfide reductase-related iron-sulfur binding cluster [Rhodocyclaceae bacterium]|nr:heterodisulfide reductase-related iron-sulfur binding cluster [Rhodocyclaceae bacterium]